MSGALQKTLEFLAAVCLYVFLFYSIFAVYYTSPLVRGTSLVPLNVSHLATHLIFMVTDGMRADKLFGSQLKYTPFIRNILLNKGAWGLSHTRVPTESRPGHIAMLGGFYEDVASITKGWQANAVEFDSILNRSQRAWAWGTHEVVQAFGLNTVNLVMAKSSPSELSDLVKHSISDIDRWTVDQFLAELYNKETGFLATSPISTDQSSTLRKGHVAFLHLDAADLVGHAFKPNSNQYVELLRHLDGLVEEVVREVKKASEGLNVTVAFILTADHGMTDWGSHGAGSIHETVTPLLVWGEGLSGPKLLPDTEIGQPVPTDKYGLPPHIEGRVRRDIQQADLCPLMASLIGVPIPVNSVGRVPLALLNVSDSVKVKLVRANCLQLLSQLRLKREEKLRSHFKFFFKEFPLLNEQDTRRRLKEAEKLESSRAYPQSIVEYERLTELILAALNYYHTYDRQFLGVCIGITFALWSLAILSTLRGSILSETPECSRPLHIFRFVATGIVCFCGLLVLSLASLCPPSHTLCQLVPLVLALYLLWSPSLRRLLSTKHDSEFPRVTSRPSQDGTIHCSSFAIGLLRSVSSLCVLELLIWGFHYRPLLSAACLVVALWPLLDPSFGHGLTRVRCLWSFACLLLAVFPLLPVIGSFFQPFLAGFSGLVISAIGVLCSHWLSSSSACILPKYRPIHPSATDFRFGCIYGILAALASCAVLLVRSSIELPSVISLSIQLFSWSTLALPLVLFLRVPPRLGFRIFGSFSACVIPFILLSTGYEVIFLCVFLLVGLLWIRLEASSMKMNELWFINTRPHAAGHNEQPDDTKDALNFRNFRQSLFFIFLLVLSFFGTGNIASVNSFDPRSTYCFITLLKPAVMAVFLMLKILIPMLCLGVIYGAMQLASLHSLSNHSTAFRETGTQITQTALCVIMSNFIAVHFFVWLRDEGSWLDIGTSISHYVIAMGIGLVSFLFSSLGRKILCLNISEPCVNDRNGVRKYM
ncbi:hypothetical protein CRM22_000862 [Opisthorchis felineus]|uniref:GPI ethanolamine phosphate transferase 1 n=2 Tax=Opisthorchis felineus TaxID=147828 RepID=A0A4S2MDE6_OPIFE|nr:hypothetical protein CRM22_000862 [Opisthorchis felineus]